MLDTKQRHTVTTGDERVPIMPHSVIPLRARDSVIVRPRHRIYNPLRSVWNAAFTRRYPHTIIPCASLHDVQYALHYAQKHHLPVTVRAGGYSPAGYSTIEQGLVIDMRGFNRIVVNPLDRLASVGAGQTWATVDAATQLYGLATTGATVSSVGVAGFVQGGGIGYLTRRQGLGSDALIEATLVAADGRVHVAALDRGEEAKELLWGIRLGGGNFGVLTRLVFRLQPLPSVVTCTLVYPMDAAVQVLREVRERTENAPNDLTWTATFGGMCAEREPYPTTRARRLTLKLNVIYFGPPERAESVLAPFQAIAEPMMATSGPTRYTDLQRWRDASSPPGMNWTMRAHWLRTLEDEDVSLLVDAFSMSTRVSPLNQVMLTAVGGTLEQEPIGGSPFSFRHMARYVVEVLDGSQPDSSPTYAQAQRLWGQHVLSALEKRSVGEDMNYFSRDSTRIQSLYSEDAWRQMLTLKQSYDPENIFRSNANIPPFPQQELSQRVK